jgi:transposase
MGDVFSMRSCGWRVRVLAGGICPRIGSAPTIRSSVATRYDKLAANFLDFIKIASIMLWLK